MELILPLLKDVQFMPSTMKLKKNMGMRAKLIWLFVVIKVLPLGLLALIAWDQALNLDTDANKSLNETSDVTVLDTKRALTNLATEAIERLTTDAALRVAEFLYRCDSDTFMVSSLEPNYDTYKAFVENTTGRLMVESQWVIDESNNDPVAAWKNTKPVIPQEQARSTNPQNNQSFHTRVEDLFEYENVPIYREITFINLEGQETIKITTSDVMDKELKDVSDKANTFVKAEDYWHDLQELEQGELYVSDVIGAYTPSQIIGIYNKFNADRVGIEFDPESSAFAGWENPVGKKFQGIIRFATPVYDKDNQKIGYVTLALNHDHLIELMEHINPMDVRYTELSDAFAGNYAFIWDYKGKSVVHPRHHSIIGVNPNTGEWETPWLEQEVYNRWQASGLPYNEYIVKEPTFFEQSREKKPSVELLKEGLVGLDCRYLHNAPQCTGWYDLGGNGGSGSFVILWSGLIKLTTAAAIPYYSGNYAHSKVGFGVVTIGAGIDEFLAPATEMAKRVEKIIETSNKTMASNLVETATSLTVSTAVMTAIVIFIAVWLASAMTKRIDLINKGLLRFRRGERQFRFNEPVRDEMGILCQSFDDMADSIVKSVNDIVIIIDSEDKVIYLNKEAEQVMGLSLEETYGKKYEEITTLGDLNPLERERRHQLKEVYQHPVTKQFYRADVERSFDEEGEYTGAVITIQDVTDIILQQQEIALQRRLLLTVFASSPDIIWYKDQTNKYLAINPRFSSIMGKDEKDIIGLTSDDILPQKFLPADITNDKVAKEKKKPIYSEEEYLFKDGHTEILEIVRTPVFNEKNEFEGIVGVARDMSDRVTIEKRLRETQKGLETAVRDANKANATKTVFLARMSHEMRTPMNAILGMSTVAKDMLEDPQTTPKDVDIQINQIEVSAKHLLGLVNEILETSKLDTAVIKLKKEPMVMSDLIKDVSTIVKDFCDDTNVKFKIDMPELGNKTFLSDQTRIRQVLISLFTNAINQASPNGEVLVKIEQEQVGGLDTRFTFTIEDNGKGMTQEKQNALENPPAVDEVLANMTTADDHFALSLSQLIVQYLGGKIKVEKADETGNTLKFAFALEQMEKEEVKEEKKATNLDILKGKRALLVDDVEINRVILRALLSSVKTQVEEADDGDVALEKFENSPVGYYDIVLMDIQMPKMNGFEATTAIRNLDRADSKSVPILAVTANSFEEDIKKSLDSGMNAHFAKPVNRDSLFDTMVNLFIQAK